ncbi:MAG: nucleoside deaminase [Pirellulaceae bacterium]|jgi:tRNA(Arg) A34 adenosine deaminase TadA|nr:nucleoside deaminase [Pirellulaceae bacterium]
MIDPVELMQLAVEAAQRGIADGQSPFGCAIASNDKVLAVAHNTVVASTDITAHAEINALRAACRVAEQVHLEDSLVATTCEPCPMCMAALHWARVGTVLFGATIADAESAGFNELRVPAAEVLKIGGSTVRLESGVLADECQQLFRLWQECPDRVVY